MCNNFSITQIQPVPGHLLAIITQRFSARIADYFIRYFRIEDLTKAGTSKYFKGVVLRIEEVNIKFIHFLSKLHKNEAR